MTIEQPLKTGHLNIAHRPNCLIICYLNNLGDCPTVSNLLLLRHSNAILDHCTCHVNDSVLWINNLDTQLFLDLQHGNGLGKNICSVLLEYDVDSRHTEIMIPYQSRICRALIINISKGVAQTIITCLSLRQQYCGHKDTTQETYLVIHKDWLGVFLLCFLKLQTWEALFQDGNDLAVGDCVCIGDQIAALG